VSRWVNGAGRISLAGFDYVVGATFAGEPVEVIVSDGLVEILHAGVLVALHPQRLKADRIAPARLPVQRRAR
jgi:Mu transposase, C-terminal domain